MPEHFQDDSNHRMKSQSELVRDAVTPPAARHVDSNELLQGSKTLVIHHAGNEYRLTITRNDKLILQK